MIKKPYAGQEFLYLFMFLLISALIILISLSFTGCIVVKDKLPPPQQYSEQQIENLKERNYLVEVCIKAHQLKELILDKNLDQPSELKEALEECKSVGL